MGLNSSGDGIKKYDTSQLPQRVGFLSHPGFLANMGSTSFVGRGVILTKRVLCRDIQAPPAGIEDKINDTATETLDLTPRQASEYRFELGGSCLACHRTFEPVAFAFEQFDVLGRHTTENEKGEALFTSGYLQNKDGSEGPTYQGVAELMSTLEQSQETSTCFVKNMFEFGLGRHYPKYMTDEILDAHDNYIASGGDFPALLRAVALSPLFRTQFKED